MNRVVVAIILGPEKLMLMGQRRDNTKYTLPAGHCNENEAAHAAVCREVKEETGLRVEEAMLVHAGMSAGGKLIYTFICKASGQLDTTQDPDQEVEHWTWEDPFDRVQELHVSANENFAIQWYARHYEILKKM